MQLASLDFGFNDDGFTLYVLGLLLSAVVQFVIAFVGFGTSRGARIIAGIFGAGFLAYGIYLGFIFDSGAYRLFPYWFLIPVAFAVNAVRESRERRDRQEQ